MFRIASLSYLVLKSRQFDQGFKNVVPFTIGQSFRQFPQGEHLSEANGSCGEAADIHRSDWTIRLLDIIFVVWKSGFYV